MTTDSNSTARRKRANWLTQMFSSSDAPSSPLTSISNPAFESFTDIIQPRRAEQSPAAEARQQSAVEQTLAEISANAGSDVSSLRDRSKGRTDFFSSSSVSDNGCPSKQMLRTIAAARQRYPTSKDINMLIGLRSIGSVIRREIVCGIN